MDVHYTLDPTKVVVTRFSRGFDKGVLRAACDLRSKVYFISLVPTGDDEIEAAVRGHWIGANIIRIRHIGFDSQGNFIWGRINVNGGGVVQLEEQLRQQWPRQIFGDKSFEELREKKRIQTIGTTPGITNAGISYGKEWFATLSLQSMSKKKEIGEKHRPTRLHNMKMPRPTSSVGS